MLRFSRLFAARSVVARMRPPHLLAGRASNLIIGWNEEANLNAATANGNDDFSCGPFFGAAG
jgi:hypothetical protein